MDDSLKGKLSDLKDVLASYPSALVAYSGGVDSTLVARLAREILGERMKAVLVSSPLHPPRELERAERTAAVLDIPLVVVRGDELSLPGFADNPPERCYLCKRYRLELLRSLADGAGFTAVLEGSNLDDAGAHRPGRRAIAESGAASPLEDAGLSKAEVRAAARELGVPNWDAPSRPCLATRFPYGTLLERDLIALVDAAEQALEDMGMRELRVRLEGPGAVRLEVGAEEMTLLDVGVNRDRLVKKLSGLGILRIELDLEGFRSGSMDEKREDRRCITLYDESDRAGVEDGGKAGAAGTEC